jgi:hypothetical protein
MDVAGFKLTCAWEVVITAGGINHNVEGYEIRYEIPKEVTK